MSVPGIGRRISRRAKAVFVAVVWVSLLFPRVPVLADPTTTDSDGDGYSDYDEGVAGTDPNDPSSYPGSSPDPWTIDSDGDGYSDGEEIAGGYDPNNAAIYPGYEYSIDSDGDGYSDYDESMSGTDPWDPSSYPGSSPDPWTYDTDGDGYSDGDEWASGTDPYDSTSYPGSYDPTTTDSDGDGWTNADEIAYGSDPYDSSSYPSYGPGYSPDSDGDGYSDYDEGMAGTDPYNPSSYPGSNYLMDSDGDGWSDGDELAHGTDPYSSSSYPGAPDPYTTDSDGDGYSDYDENVAGTDPNDPLSYPGYLNNLDSDGDGHTDAYEISMGYDPYDSTSYPGMDHSSVDSDGDGWSDYDENIAGTNPHDSSSYPGSTYDSDGDGYSDTDEIAAGTDPYNPSEYPGWNTGGGGYDSGTDSDGDGLSDYAEVYTHGTDPNKPDTDGDGLSDYSEVNGIHVEIWVLDSTGSYLPYAETYYTDPTKADSDGDLLPDGWEIQHGYHPLYAGDGLSDSDGDGLTAGQEVAIYFTDPFKRDTDEDGESDGYEVAQGTNPLDRESRTSADSDGDVMSDAWETQHGLNPQNAADASLDPDGDGLTNHREYLLGTDPANPDSDGDGYLDGFEWSNGFNPANPSDRYIDSDGDGMPNLWEIFHGLNPHDSTDQYSDADGDGLWAYQEFEGGFSPNLADTNGNGISDYDEFWGIGSPTDSDGDGLADETEAILGTDPHNADTDGDGISDYAEVHGLAIQVAFNGVTHWISYQTNPLLADTDDDGMDDLYEIQHFFDPTDPSDGAEDEDGDGLTNGAEVSIHFTDPFEADTDGDGVSDGLEISHGTDPLDATSSLLDLDGDLMRDSWEVANGLDPNDPSDATEDPDGDFVVNLEEFRNGTNPFSKDSDGDGYEDNFEVQHGFDPTDPTDADLDSDGDGMPDLWEITYGLNRFDETDGGGDLDGDHLTNFEEYLAGTRPILVDTDGDGLSDYAEMMTLRTAPEGTLPASYYTDPLDPDSDGDLMPDGFEIANGLHALNPGDGDEDRDGDGLTNGKEVGIHGTDWKKKDTDSDGESDGYEVANGTNPLDILSRTSIDSDGDHMSDVWEIAMGLHPGVHDGALDPDGDGLNNHGEYLAGTDPFNPDTDGDTYKDGFERTHGRNPLDPTDALVDTDGDGLPDLWEIQHGLPWQNPVHESNDPDFDGIENLVEFQNKTNPNLSDSDGDGISDFDEIAGAGTSPGGIAWTYDVDPTEADTDGDGESDLFEIEHGTDPTDPASRSTVGGTGPGGTGPGGTGPGGTGPGGTDPGGTDPGGTDPGGTDPGGSDPGGSDPNGALPGDDGSGFLGLVSLPLDSDGDGVSDEQEVIDGTDRFDVRRYLSPLTPDVDADRDGLADAWELANGLDPTDPTDAWRDPDYDRLNNLLEQANGTSPFGTWVSTPLSGMDPIGTQVGQDPRLPASTLATFNDFGEMTRISLIDGVLAAARYDGSAWGEAVPIDLPFVPSSFGEVVMNNFGLVAVEVRAGAGAGQSVRVVVLKRDGSVDLIGEGRSWVDVSDVRITDSGFVAGRCVEALPSAAQSVFRWREGDLLVLPHSGQVRLKGLSERGGILEHTLGLYRGGSWDASAAGPFALGPYGELHPAPKYPAFEALFPFVRQQSASQFGEVVSGVVPVDPVLGVVGHHARIALEAGEFVQTEGEWLAIHSVPYFDDPDIPAGGFWMENSGGHYTYQTHDDPAAEIHEFDFDFDDDGFWDVFETTAGTDPDDPEDFPGWASDVVVSDANRAGDFVGWIHRDETRIDSASGLEVPSNDAYLWQYRDFQFFGGADQIWTINNTGAFIASDNIASEDPNALPGDPPWVSHSYRIFRPDHDADGDGIADEWEAYHRVDNPSADPDGDGLTTRQEFVFGTSPRNPDTDGDGLPDAWEVRYGTNPLKREAGLLDDIDGDGLNWLAEAAAGTDPYRADTDGDGIRDDWELKHGYDPLSSVGAPAGSADSDNDGFTNSEEYAAGTDPFDPLSNPTFRDTDQDGIPDGWEVQHGLNPHDPTDASLDLDDDGLTNLQEFQIGRNPRSPSTRVSVQDLAWEPSNVGNYGGVPHFAGSMNDLGQIAKVTQESGTLYLRIWNRTTWSDAVSLGSAEGFTRIDFVRMNNRGLVAVQASNPATLRTRVGVFGAGSKSGWKGADRPWKSIEHLVVTESGIVGGMVYFDTSPTTHAAFQWRDGSLTEYPLPSGQLPRRGLSERGEMLSTDYILRRGEWIFQEEGYPLAVSPYGAVWHRTRPTDIFAQTAAKALNATSILATTGRRLSSRRPSLNSPWFDSLQVSGPGPFSFDLGALAPADGSATLVGSYGTDMNSLGNFVGFVLHEFADQSNSEMSGPGGRFAWRGGAVQGGGTGRYYQISERGHLFGERRDTVELYTNGLDDLDGDGEPDGPMPTGEYTEVTVWDIDYPGGAATGGIPSDWMAYHGLTDPNGDADGDGLSNQVEFALGLDPKSIDSDGDGLPDRWELEHGFPAGEAQAADTDSDGDGFSDYLEYLLGTDPFDPDDPGEGNNTVPILTQELAADLLFALHGTGGVDADGDGAVVEWSDWEGGPVSFAQGDGALRPRWIGSAVNDLPVVRFEGGDRLVEASGLAEASSFHVFGVFAVEEAWGHMRLFGSDAGLSLELVDGVVAFRASPTADPILGSTVVLADKPHYMAIDFDQTSQTVRVYLDGGLEIETVGLGIGLADISLGAADGVLEGVAFLLPEVLALKRSLGEEDRVLVRNRLAHKYDIDLRTVPEVRLTSPQPGGGSGIPFLEFKSEIDEDHAKVESVAYSSGERTIAYSSRQPFRVLAAGLQPDAYLFHARVVFHDGRVALTSRVAYTVSSPQNIAVPTKPDPHTGLIEGQYGPPFPIPGGNMESLGTQPAAGGLPAGSWSAGQKLYPRDLEARFPLNSLSDYPGDLTRVELSWLSPDFGGAGSVSYRVERSVNGGEFEVIVGSTPSTSYVDLSVLVGDHYTYRVSVVDQGSISTMILVPVVLEAREVSASLDYWENLYGVFLDAYVNGNLEANYHRLVGGADFARLDLGQVWGYKPTLPPWTEQGSSNSGNFCDGYSPPLVVQGGYEYYSRLEFDRFKLRWGAVDSRVSIKGNLGPDPIKVPVLIVETNDDREPHYTSQFITYDSVIRSKPFVINHFDDDLENGYFWKEVVVGSRLDALLRWTNDDGHLVDVRGPVAHVPLDGRKVQFRPLYEVINDFFVATDYGDDDNWPGATVTIHYDRQVFDLSGNEFPGEGVPFQVTRVEVENPATEWFDLNVSELASLDEDDERTVIRVTVEFRGMTLESKTKLIPGGGGGDDDDSPGTYSVSASDAASPKFRKVSLAGLPLPDEAPEGAAERDEEREQTYLDALTAQLRHSTTDVYVRPGASSLPLSVRRNATAEIWNLRHGLLPEEKRVLPFGKAWTTNLCAYLEFSTHSVQVHDQDGYAQEFTYGPGIQTYIVKPGNLTETRGYLNSLRREGTGWIFEKKFGGSVEYEAVPGAVQYVPNDRVNGQAGYETIDFARAVSVKDAAGNELRYEYTGENDLIPSRIHDPARPGLQIYIRKTGNRVGTVWDPMGRETTYQYDGNDFLVSVTRPDGAVVSYAYDEAVELDQDPAVPEDPEELESDPPVNKFHANLASITNADNETTSFHYAFDNTVVLYRQDSEYQGYYQQTGLPRTVTRIDLPTGVSTHLERKAPDEDDPVGDRLIKAAPGDLALEQAYSRTRIIDAEGNERRYEFSNFDFIDLSRVEKTTSSSPSNSGRIVLYAQQLKIFHPGEPTPEIFTFDIGAGLAPKTATDIFGNTTLYEYDDPFSRGVAFEVYYPRELARFRHFDDPTAEIDALGNRTEYTYDAKTRVMTSITDPLGRRTEYSVNSLGQRTEERILDASGTLVSKKTFAYAHPVFRNFLTQTRTVKLPGDGSPSIDLVVSYQADSHGRVLNEIVAPGSLAITSSYLYDLNGNRTSTTDPNGRVTSFAYDDWNRLVGVQYPDADPDDDLPGATTSMTYTPSGRLHTETDPNGVVTTHSYDAMGRRLSSSIAVRDGEPVVTSRTYNSVGSVLTETDPRGTVTRHEYDALQRLVSTTTAFGTPEAQTSQLFYGENSGSLLFDSTAFKPTRSVDPRGYITEVEFDELNRVLRSRREYRPGLFAVTRHVYDAAGNLVRSTDPRERETRTQYDALNRPVLVTHPDGTTNRTVHDSLGRVWKTVNEAGRFVETRYDAAGRLSAVLQPAVDNGLGGVTRPTTRTQYDAAGNAIAVVDPLGNTTITAYDARNRPVRVTLPAAYDTEEGEVRHSVVTTRYDLVGNPVAVTDALGHITTTAYDDLSRPVSVTTPPVPVAGETELVSLVTTTTYDPNGNVLTVTDPAGRVTTNTYDLHNRLATTTDAEDILVSFEHDAAGNRTRVVDGRGFATIMEYDGLDRLVRTERPDQSAESLLYDAVHLVRRTDAAGRHSHYLYDPRGRLKSVSHAGSNQARTYHYDSVGNILSVIETGAAHRNVSYTYDALNRPISETSAGVTHGYRYDLAGNRTHVFLGNTDTVLVSGYDSRNRLAFLDEEGRLTLYGYDARDAMVARTLPSGQLDVHYYDALGRKEHSTGYADDSQAPGAVQYQFTYRYDRSGNLVVSTEAMQGMPARTLTMAYDDIGRLLAEHDAVTGAPAKTTTYSYDAAGNRLYKGIDNDGDGQDEEHWTTAVSADGLNRIGSVTDHSGAVVTFGYDLLGNRTSRSAAGSTRNLAYDRDNRLVEVSEGSDTWRYGYDYRTRRVLREENGQAERISFSGGTSVQEYSASAPNSPTVEYIRGSDMGGGIGGILYSLRGGTPSYAHYNARGDVVAKSGADGGLTWQARYEGFGSRTAEIGSNPDKQRANTREEEPWGGLYENMRWRDLETGQYFTRDPAGFVDGPNLYAYVNQNPWSAFDPHGLSTWSNIWKGEFDSAETTWGGVGGQTVVGFVPVVGQIADVRDSIASIMGVASDPGSGAAWGNLGMTAVAWIPGVGDAVKGALKAGKKGLNGAGEVRRIPPGGGGGDVPTGGGGSPPSGGGKGGDGNGGGSGGGSDPAGGASPSGEGAPFVPDEAWTNNAPAHVTPGTTRVDHTKLNKTTGEFEQSRVTYDEFGRQNYRVDKTDHGRPRGNGHPNDQGHSNPHLHESTYAPEGTQGHNDKTGRKEVQHNLE